MGDDCCGGDRNGDDTVAPRTVLIIIGVVMLLGWGALVGFLLS